jgi:hypothetical protein
MSVLRWLRSFSIPVVTIIVLAFCSDAVAQTSYKVTDLGADRPQRATGEKAKRTPGIVCKREGRRLERLVSIDRGNPR